MVFDLPNHSGSFASRFTTMRNIISQNHSPYLQMVQQQRFDNNAQLQQFFEQIINQGGEGLMLHHSNSLYQAGRTTKLIKFKPKYDAEAIVVSHIAGKGKFTGMLGALTVKNIKDGKIFKIGTGFSNKQRQNPPAIGSTITYSYSGITTNGLPRFASFVRIKPQ